MSNEQKAQKAFERLLENEEQFSGLCDEIYLGTGDDTGYVCFRFGGDVYKLWHYSINKYPLFEVRAAVRRERDSRRNQKK